MICQTLSDVFERGRAKEKQTLVVAAAHDVETLKAVARAKREKLIEPILVGDKELIMGLLLELNEPVEAYDIRKTGTPEESAEMAVCLVRENQASLLMKGHLDTSVLLRAVVNKEKGITAGKAISHVNIMELKGYDKLVALTDVAIIIAPHLMQKQAIIENAVQLFHQLGYKTPKVAVLAAIEKENVNMPETIDAAELTKLNQEDKISKCIVEGPLSFDIAMDKGRASRKNYQGKIQGDADILVVPNVVSGNLLSKGLGIFGESKAVGIVMGARVPIILTSRGTEANGKYESILACLAVV